MPLCLPGVFLPRAVPQNLFMLMVVLLGDGLHSFLLFFSNPAFK